VLNVYRFDHICQVVPELDPQLKLLEGLFGFHRRHSWESDEEGCRGVLLDIPGSWGHRWELLEPRGSDSPYQAFLDSPQGPGIHHVAIEVPDMKAALGALKAQGVGADRLTIAPNDRWFQFPFVPPARETGLLMRVFGAGRPAGCADAGCEIEGPRVEVDRNAPRLGIVAVEQVGHGYWDRDELVPWCEAMLGMHEVYRTPEGKHPDIATLVLTLPGTHIRWEIIQPVDQNSFVQRFLDRKGAAAHHVTFEVADWDAALQACEHHGVPTLDINEGTTDGAAWRDTFIHPRYAGGFLVQFFWEARPGVWSRSDKVPLQREG
jgi:catechol 2,3-dioxygenase-like lactoylglutathione lyase family enzyme